MTVRQWLKVSLVSVFSLQCWTALFALGLLIMGCASARAEVPVGTCFGKFPDPITDYCWSCIFPISIGAARVVDLRQDDRENPASPICLCPTSSPPWVRIGVSVGYWEPTRLVEIVHTPYCFPALGGLQIGKISQTTDGAQAPRAAVGGSTTASFYHAHYYTNPILTILKAISGFNCLEKGSMDIAYMTELDPSWQLDDLNSVLTPENVLFANLVADVICIADCIAATADMPLDPLFWCAGCNGEMFPLSGLAQAHIGGIQASSLLVERMQFKMHRELIAQQWWDAAALCGPVEAPMITKSAYKTQLMYPFSQTTIAGQCCSPMGRSTVLFSPGMEYPVKGEDYVYQVFRKRNCCASYGD